MSFLSSFDVFPKYKENVKVKTMFGAGVSIAAIIVMVFLFIAEFWDYLSIKIEDHLVIDNTEYELLPINFNITLHRIPCSSSVKQHLSFAIHSIIHLHSGESGCD